MLSKNAAMIFGILSSSGRQTVSDLMRRTKLSQPMISRGLNEVGLMDNLIIHRDGRGFVYALAKQIRSLPIKIPVYHIGAGNPASQGAGNPASQGESVDSLEAKIIGSLSALVGGGFSFCDNNGKTHLFDGMPWFLQDIRPQGYLGRAFCHTHATSLELSHSLGEWSDDDALFALSMLGGDAPGNLIVGSGSLSKVTAMPECEPNRYDEIAELLVAGTLPGSSAGGEHPKFVSGNRIVKFSPVLDGSAVSLRWSDLLVSEHCAAAVLSAHGVLAADNRIVISQRRCYLESIRYDRAGSFGRIGVVSIGAIDDEFVGERRNWTATAKKLVSLRLLASDAAREIDTIEQFGRLIGNTDMHFGNLSFFFDGPPLSQFPASDDTGSPALEGSKTKLPAALRLAPVYDMLPMRYAPEKGEIVERFVAPIESDNQLSIEMAISFWLKVKNHDLISESFREIAIANLCALEGAYHVDVASNSVSELSEAGNVSGFRLGRR